MRAQQYVLITDYVIFGKIKNNFKFANHVSIDHRQLQVLHGEFELQLKLQCELTLIHRR